jgi:TPR repeat protein
MANLGYLYFKKGRINNQEDQYLEAAHWFRFSLAEDPNQKDTNYYMGLMYKNGLGIEKCFTFAYRHLKISAELGHGNACSECGDIAYAGLG